MDRKMPDYEIREWSLKNLPNEVLNHSFVSSAIREKKWAYATDYIRLWALYNYGGIYMDMDVMVYKPFDVFLKYRAFSSIEFDPRLFYKTLNKKKIIGVGIEAALLGFESHHEWIKDIMNYYADKIFINNPKYYEDFIMPRILTHISREKYGFKMVPTYQILEKDIHIFSCDVFSSIYSWTTISTSDFKPSDLDLGESPTRYAYHMCAHSWYEDYYTKSLIYKIKRFILQIFGKSNIAAIKRLFSKRSIT
ncbi:glycosyltransferase family 32 protein [Barnesiella viscericola]|uniref:glycosyltransferase family 32 protein n=1 Tax=Barnesiella viscericola TaxID=397865 RepID=UPI00255C1B21|nr:glycosyltransferase [Barnesiella viscericola]